MRISMCGLLLALSLLLAWQAFQIDGPAAMYPIMVTLGASVTSAGYLIMEVVRQGADMPESSPIAPGKGTAGTVRILGFAVVWLLYVLLLPILGFLVSTWMTLFVTLILSFGQASARSAIGTGLFTLVLAVLMKTILYVPVPQGWADEMLDILIYRFF